jgi:hypothetical protein
VVIEVNRNKQTVAVEYNLLDLESESRVLKEVERDKLKSVARELEHI